MHMSVFSLPKSLSLLMFLDFSVISFEILDQLYSSSENEIGLELKVYTSVNCSILCFRVNGNSQSLVHFIHAHPAQ